MTPTSFQLQLRAAEELELRIWAKIAQLESEGVVKVNVVGDVEVLDRARYEEAMGGKLNYRA